MIPLVCKRCGHDILHRPQFCLLGNPRRLYCEAELVWIGFRFSENLAYERHRFCQALKAAHFHADEIGNSVVAETEDIVAVDAIFKRTVNHGRGRVFADRFTESELQAFANEHKDDAAKP